MRLPLRTARDRRGFTLIEIIVVVLIIAVLVALLLPAILNAVNNAKNAAVAAEINVISQAMADFRSKYNDYPPSRILLVENGNYYPFLNNTSYIAPGDITYAQLAQRSVTYLRKFFPRVTLFTSSAGSVSPNGNTPWYDFNGNGNLAGNGPNEYYILQGYECLVFFLGGIPNPTTNSDGTVTFGMTGFAKDTTNPFASAAMATYLAQVNGQVYGNLPNLVANRYAPFFEFRAERLFDDNAAAAAGIPVPNFASVPNGQNFYLNGFPGYVDSINTGVNSRYYAYFSSYGNNGYDPNDVNVVEHDDEGLTLQRYYYVGFPTSIGVSFNPPNCLSMSPNPYTTSLPEPNPNVGTPTPTAFHKPQTFQIISAGRDGTYGPGGQFLPQATDRLPNDAAFIVEPDGQTPDPQNERVYEHDNITNFATSRLQ